MNLKLRITPRWLPLTFALWAGAIAAGLVPLAQHQFTAGDAATPPTYWPGASNIQRTPGRPTLVMFTHGNCPCTRASLGELDQILAHHPHQLDAFIVAFRTETTPDPAADRTGRITATGLAMTFDDDGAREANLFQARTSGQVMLYAHDGRLTFSGGITGSRGHAGENAGRTAVEMLLDGQRGPVVTTPVFGCTLPACSVRTRSH